MKIVCDPTAASEAMDTIDQRHEALMGHLWAEDPATASHNTVVQAPRRRKSAPISREPALRHPEIPEWYRHGLRIQRPRPGVHTTEVPLEAGRGFCVRLCERRAWFA